MARIYPGTKRIQITSFAFYGQDFAGEETILVRRKVGEPCDYQHSNNRRLKLQRLRMANASKAYAKLNWFERQYWHKRYEYY